MTRRTRNLLPLVRVFENVKARAAGKPWWLDEGTEICPACLQPYAHHAARRCAHCDTALCPACIEAEFEQDARCGNCAAGDCEE